MLKWRPNPGSAKHRQAETHCYTVPLARYRVHFFLASPNSLLNPRQARSGFIAFFPSFLLHSMSIPVSPQPTPVRISWTTYSMFISSYSLFIPDPPCAVLCRLVSTPHAHLIPLPQLPTGTSFHLHFLRLIHFYFFVLPSS